MIEHGLGYAVLTEDPAFAAVVRRVLEETGSHGVCMENRGTLQEAAEHLAELRRSGAHVLVAQLGEGVDASAAALGRLSSALPELTVMVVGRSLPSEDLLLLIRAGAAEYLPTPVTMDDLGDAMHRISIRRSALEGDVRREGRTYAVFGAKGGTGVTTTALNLALDLQARSGESVVLADLDVLDGGAEVLLDLQPRYTVLDVVRSFHRLDEGLLRSFLLDHPSGLKVLAAPRTALEGERLSPDQMVQLVHELRLQYDRVILDMGNSLTAMALAVLQQVHKLVMVVAPTVECLKSAKRVRGVLRQHAPEVFKHLHVVLNFSDPNALITPAEVSRVLETELEASLSRDDDLMCRCASAGRPAVLDGSSRYARELRRVSSLVGELEETDDGGFIRSLFGGLLHRNGRSAPAPTGAKAPSAR